MITAEQKLKFRKLLFDFLKDENIKADDADFNKLLRSWSEEFSTKTYRNLRNDISEKDKNDFFMLHKKIVLEVLNFLDYHQNIQNLIEETQKSVSEEWNKDIDDDKLKLIPDIRCYFGADGLDESIKEKNWTAATDSALSINVGNQTIIESC